MVVAMSPSTDVRSAVLDLVAALDRYDTDAVLAAVAPNVTFVLTSEAAPLRSREELRQVVEQWRAVGPAVEACHAWDLKIRELGPDAAIATQMLSFHLAGVPAPVRQCETLVLARDDDGRWLVVHGHRSPGPYEWVGESRLGARIVPTAVPAAG
jgi:ketosteroid isomerase-like protein